MRSSSALSGGRIHVLDALRGFALAGIVIVHMVEQYLAAMPPHELAGRMSSSLPDKVVAGLNQLFLVGKFFAIFSFLFGLSFFIQMRGGDRRGERFEGRFIWKLVILFVIGYGHSLFYRGDILTIYALLGLLLVIFYRAGTGVVLGIAVIIFSGIPRYLVFALNGGEPIFPGTGMSPELPLNDAYLTAVTAGSLWDVFSRNAWHGQLSRLEFQINVFARWYLTFGFFLIGLWLGRAGLFERLSEFRPAIRKTLRISLAGVLVCLVAAGLAFSQIGAGSAPPSFDSWPSMIALTTLDLFNLSLTALIVCSFLLLYLRPAGERLLGRLAPYGRMALSNYVMQSLIGTFLLYNWGLGLIGKIGNAQAFLIALALISAQVLASTWWLRRFRYGPLEWLWRSATRLRWQTLLRRPA